MNALPRDSAIDATWALWRDPHGYISTRGRELGTDFFESRIGLQRTICLVGSEAAALFHDTARCERTGALPGWVSAVLFGRGGVQGLDGDAHRHRKAMFTAITAPDRVDELSTIAERIAARRSERWPAAGRVSLYAEFQAIFCSAVCEWAGVPLPSEDVGNRAAQMTTLFESATAIGPKYWWARLTRARLEGWISRFVAEVRSGVRRVPSGCAVETILNHRDRNGDRLDDRTAAVEILNVLRPTVAVAGFAVFAALALHRSPECRERLDDPEYAEWFALEVRRLFPFFPILAARVRQDFEWRGCRFPKGRRVLLEVRGTNLDPRRWDDPEVFRPERFRGRDVGPFEYLPQGGGDTAGGHRCPGERIAIELVKMTTRLLASRLDYHVPPQDLDLEHGRSPALPPGGFVIDDVRAAMPSARYGEPPESMRTTVGLRTTTLMSRTSRR